MNFIYKILFFSFFIISTNSLAQQKIYFDENWEVTTAKNMVYYREVSKKDKLFHIKDFYRSGKMQMEGFASNANLDNEVFQGKVTWYFENGKIQKTAEFKDGEQVGTEKEYDEEGRIITDLTYDKNGFSGIKREYNGEGKATSELWEYENSDVIKKIFYDENPKGIRYEIYFPKNDIGYYYKYYDEEGNLIGEKRNNQSEKFKNTEVEYYNNPMKVYRITKKDERGYEQEVKAYYPNGILKYEQYFTKDGYKKAYDEEGKLIGEIKYTKYNSFEWYTQPWNGDDVIFDEDNLYLKTIATIKEGITVKVKTFFPNGDKKIVDYVDTKVSKSEYFDKSGNSIGTMTYDDAEKPITGTRFDYTERKVTTYKDGKLLIEIKKDGEGKIIYEKKYNESQKKYFIKIFNKDKTLNFTFELPENLKDDVLTTEINIYKNGKQAGKVRFTKGILQNGKIVFEYKNCKIVLERKENLIISKTYDEDNKLIDETKGSVDVNNKYFGTRIYESDFLNLRDDKINKVIDSEPVILK